MEFPLDLMGNVSKYTGIPPNCYWIPVTFSPLDNGMHSEIPSKLTDGTKWASSPESLSSGFPTKRVSNQSPQL